MSFLQFLHNNFMEGFFSSFMPFLRKFFVESLLLGMALTLTLVSLSIYVYISSEKKQESFDQVMSVNTNNQITDHLMVEITGAVHKPGVYKLPQGSRLKDVLVLSKGLTDEADSAFFARNYNLARFILDQEKIYIPTQLEIVNDVFGEHKQILDYTAPQTKYMPSVQTNTPTSLSINTATVEELDTLPGIGQAGAAKIIQSRPFATLDELVTKKAINKNVFEQVKNLISL